jgi:dihydrolipoamide dehydrogenase
VGDPTFDLIVIGSGPGGYVAAIRSAQLGFRTAVVEKDKVGGRCLNYACIPAKAVLRSADILSEVRDAGKFGVKVGEPEVDFAAVSGQRQKVVSTLTGGVGGLLTKNEVELVQGEAQLAGGGRVAIGERTLDARAIVLATGSVAKPLPGVSFGGRVIGTEQVWALEQLPASMAVVGAGASGAEIASAYARLGTRVQLFEALDCVLPTEDIDISRVAQRQLQRQAIEIHTKTLIEDVQRTDRSVRYRYGNERGEADWLVIAPGRAPDVEALGLEAANVQVDERGTVTVDGRMRTTAEGVWAIGDLVHGPALAHKASDEGIIAVEDSAGGETRTIEYVDIPRATFCTPNVASFGLTEAQAKEAGHDVVVGKVQYGAVGAGTVYGDRQGLIKLVGERRYGELLGGHIVGTRATELIQELVNVRALECGYPEIARIIHGHPTLSEAVMEAARAADGWLIHG